MGETQMTDIIRKGTYNLVKEKELNLNNEERQKIGNFAKYFRTEKYNKKLQQEFKQFGIPHDEYENLKSSPEWLEENLGKSGVLSQQD